jgi:hypothetical protein
MDRRKAAALAGQSGGSQQLSGQTEHPKPQLIHLIRKIPARAAARGRFIEPAQVNL